MNTTERINEILSDYKGIELDKTILKLQLENLVTQAKLEELKGENYVK